MTTQTVRDAMTVAARITGTLPPGQLEYCKTCHTGTRIIGYGGRYVVTHNPGCTSDPANQKGSSNVSTTDTTTLSPSEAAVRDALQTGGPATLVDLVKDLSLGATTVRRALKNLGAVMGEDQTFTLNGSGAAKVSASAKKAAPAKKATGKAAKQPAPAPAPAPKAAKAPAAKKAAATAESTGGRSREEAQARDEHVLATLRQHKDGLTRERLAEASGAGSRTYMSMWRLNRDGKIRKTVGGGSRQPVWHAV